MAEPSKQNHHTELQSAHVVSSGSGNVHIIEGSFAPAPNPPVNRCNLPNCHPKFVGRENKIREVMESLASRSWIIAIYGTGGIGKTTLALEVAHLCRESREDYPQIPEFTGYIWTSARDNPNFCLDDVIREILYVLSPFEKSRPLDRSEKINLAIRALSAKPCLLIIDNFETVKDESLYIFLRDRFPIPSKVLITSRHHIQLQEKVVTIGSLEEDEAVELLCHEAERLEIPINGQDIDRLRIIAKKLYGIPEVLRWAMLSVHNGKSLEWVLEKLEEGTADDIFNHILKPSLSSVNQETLRVFRSLSLLPTWTRIETIAAMCPEVAAIEESLGCLVLLCLLEDNHKIVRSERRYQLAPLTRYLASKELADTDDKGASVIKCTLEYYLNEMQTLTSSDEVATALPLEEYANIENIIWIASTLGCSELLKLCIQTAREVGRFDFQKGRTLLDYLTRPVILAKDRDLTLELFKSIDNPYVVGLPAKPPMFFGRKDLLKFTREAFESGPPSVPVIYVLGSRSIGKTSLLFQFRFQPSTSCIYISTDFQTIGEFQTADLFYYLAQKIGDEVRNRGFEIEEPRFENFANMPSQAFESYIEAVRGKLGNMYLVLMIDEFDALFHPTIREQIDIMSLLSCFRRLVQLGKLGMIVTGVTPTHELPSDFASSPFFNIVESKRISFLDRDAAIEMIQKPMDGLLHYDNRMIEILLKLSGCHPSLLQRLCFLIIDYCREKNKLLADMEAVEMAIQQAYEQEYFFSHLMNKLEEMEKSVINAAVSLTETQGDTFTKNQLNEILKRNKTKLKAYQVERSLNYLIEHEILCAVDDQGNFGFSIEIFRRWLAQKIALPCMETRATNPKKSGDQTQKKGE